MKKSAIYITVLFLSLNVFSCSNDKAYKQELARMQDSLSQVRKDIGLMALAINNIADYIDNEDIQTDINILALSIMSYSLPEVREDAAGKYIYQRAHDVMDDVINYESTMAKDIIRGHTQREPNALMMSFSEPVTNNAKSMRMVYICTGGSSNKYHAKPNCRGLNCCGGAIREVSENNAINIGRTECAICF